MGTSKLTDQQKIDVCKAYQSGINSVVLGIRYGMSSNAILGILRRRNVTIRSTAGIESQRKFTHGEPIICMDCGVLLTEDNWRACDHRQRYYICKSCVHKKSKIYWDKHLDRKRKNSRNASRKFGVKPMSDNTSCASFLGVHIAEHVLRNVFNDVEVMPPKHPGFDFICNKGKKIDVKSSCVRNNYNGWGFEINRNIIADYFLCIAFDNRTDLNPLHLWLIPGSVLNKHRGVTISKGTIDKWDEYRLPIDKVITCCDTMKYHATKS